MFTLSVKKSVPMSSITAVSDNQTSRRFLLNCSSLSENECVQQQQVVVKAEPEREHTRKPSDY